MLICQAQSAVTIPKDAAGGKYSDVHTCHGTCYEIHGQVEAICYVIYPPTSACPSAVILWTVSRQRQPSTLQGILQQAGILQTKHRPTGLHEEVCCYVRNLTHQMGHQGC